MYSKPQQKGTRAGVGGGGDRPNRNLKVHVRMLLIGRILTGSQKRPTPPRMSKQKKIKNSMEKSRQKPSYLQGRRNKRGKADDYT